MCRSTKLCAAIRGWAEIVLDLGGTSGEALRPAPRPSQRLGSISFQTTRLQTVHEGAECDRRAANGSCTSGSRCFRSLRSALASVKGQRRDHIRHRPETSRLRARSRLPSGRRRATGSPCRVACCQIASNCGSDSHLMMVPSDCRSRRKGDLVEMTLDLQMRRAVPGYAVLGRR